MLPQAASVALCVSAGARPSTTQSCWTRRHVITCVRLNVRLYFYLLYTSLHAHMHAYPGRDGLKVGGPEARGGGHLGVTNVLIYAYNAACLRLISSNACIVHSKPALLGCLGESKKSGARQMKESLVHDRHPLTCTRKAHICRSKASEPLPQCNIPQTVNSHQIFLLLSNLQASKQMKTISPTCRRTGTSREPHQMHAAMPCTCPRAAHRAAGPEKECSSMRRRLAAAPDPLSGAHTSRRTGGAPGLGGAGRHAPGARSEGL